jgi:hypothetical protein
MNEVPDRSIAHLDALLGQFGDQPAQGHIRPAGDLLQKPRPVFANQNARPMAPIFLGAALPVARKRCDHFTTLETPTRNVAATERTVSPATTRATARS